MEMSVAMAEMAVGDGITHIACTPHSNDRWTYDPESIKSRLDELKSRFEGKLTFGTGCDFHLSYENLQSLRQDSSRYTINHKNYLLVEFADYSIPPSLDQSLHEMQLAGVTPIITHPERNPLIRTKPERLFQWLHQGCVAQVTAQSILGKFGRTAQEAAERWLSAGVFHFVASDAHNVSSRPLRLKETYDHLTKQFGVEFAQALMVDNPLAAFEGRPLPYVPDLADGENENGAAKTRKKRFFFF